MKAPRPSSGGLRAPAWVLALLLFLLVLSLMLHARGGTPVDAVLFRVSVVPVTVFGIVSSLSASLLLLFVRGWMDAFHTVMQSNAVLVVVHGVLLFFGALGILQVLVYVTGSDANLATPLYQSIANLAHGK